MSSVDTINGKIAPETEAPKRKRRLRILLWVLIAAIIGVAALFALYLLRPGPLPDLLPVAAPGARAPVYMAVDAAGRVFVSDRIQSAIYVFGPDGKILDEIISPTTTLSEYVAKHAGGPPPGSAVSYDVATRRV